MSATSSDPDGRFAPSAGEFDALAADYERTLDDGLAISGEESGYFAAQRVLWLRRTLRELGIRPRRVLDFGCGTGSSAPFLFDELELESLTGVDVSRRSIDVARRRHGRDNVHFLPLDAHEPAGDVDLAFCNGVFHHIPPMDRAAAMKHVWRSLVPGGVWAFWENNPYNPGTRYIMGRLAFDRDAIPLVGSEASEMLRDGGFEVLRVDHLFVFPGFLSWLRSLEPYLASLPVGAQYQVLCRKIG
jgi:SAM-dependent methyltransferase